MFRFKIPCTLANQAKVEDATFKFIRTKAGPSQNLYNDTTRKATAQERVCKK